MTNRMHPDPASETGTIVECATTSRRTVLLTVALVAFVTSADNTIVAAAAPSIADEIGLTTAQAGQLGLAYMLPFALALLPAGAVADRWGSRSVLLVGALGFGAAGVVGAVSRDLAPLVGSRVALGIFAGLLVTSSLSLIRTSLAPRDRPTAAAVWTAGLAVALLVAPLMGGALSEYLHWSGVFWFNLPFAIAIAVASRGVAAPGAGAGDDAEGGARRRLGATIRPVRGGRGMLAVTVLATATWGIGVTGIAYYTPTVFQDLWDLGPTAAAATLSVVAVAVVLATPLVAPAVERFGHRLVCAGSMAGVALGLVVVVAPFPDHGSLALVPGLVVLGLASAFTAPLTAVALGVVRADDAGRASGAITVVRELAGAIGVAGVAAALTLGDGLGDGFRLALLSAAVLQLVAAGALLAVRPRTVEGVRW